MSDEAEIYRRAAIRAVTGKPGATYTAHDEAALGDLCERLVQGWRVAELLKANGLGLLPIDTAVALLLEKDQ